MYNEFLHPNGIFASTIEKNVMLCVSGAEVRVIIDANSTEVC